MNNKFTIVLWSVSEWEKVRRRPMIKALAKNLEGIGNILYVNTPFSPVATFLFNRERYDRNINRQVLDEVSENLFIFSPRGLLNEYTIGKLRIQRIYYRGLGKKVIRALDSLDWENCDRITWVNYPFQVDQLGIVDETFVVYECYDEYRNSFNKDKNNGWIAALEDRLLREANLVLATSEPLCESRKKIHPNVFLTPNGVDFDLFCSQEAILLPPDIASIPHPIVGYVGNITTFLDFELLNYLVDKHQNWSVVLVGPTDRDSKEAKDFMAKAVNKANIFCLGEKPHREIPSYVKCFDVAIAPFKVNPFTHCANPLTIWEYLAIGKPVVSNKLASLEGIQNVAFLGGSKEEFGYYIEDILHNGQTKQLEERVELGIELARKHSWQRTTKRLAEVLLNLLNKRRG